MSDPLVSAKVREIAHALRLPFVLRPNCVILRHSINDDVEVSVTMEVTVTQETARETRYVRRGLRLMSWKGAYAVDEPPKGARRVGDWYYQEVTLWDDDFVPYTEHKIGRIETPAEYAERRRWEGEQYRVGTAKSPMDSAYRVTFDYSPMTDYWNK